MTDRCGTYAGYQVHVRNDTKPCEPCRRANREYTRAYRARQRTGTTVSNSERTPFRRSGLGWPRGATS